MLGAAKNKGNQFPSLLFSTVTKAAKSRGSKGRRGKGDNSRIDGIRSVADVSSNVDSVVTSNSTGSRVSGVGSTEHDSTSLDDLLTLPNHRNNGSYIPNVDISTETLVS